MVSGAFHDNQPDVRVLGCSQARSGRESRTSGWRAVTSRLGQASATRNGLSGEVRRAQPKLMQAPHVLHLERVSATREDIVVACTAVPPITVLSRGCCHSARPTVLPTLVYIPCSHALGEH